MVCVHSRNVKPLTVNRYSLDLIRSKIELHQIIRSNNFPVFFLLYSQHSIQWNFNLNSMENPQKSVFHWSKSLNHLMFAIHFSFHCWSFFFLQRRCWKATPTIDNSNNNNDFPLRQFIGGNRIIWLFLVKLNFSLFQFLSFTFITLNPCVLVKYNLVHFCVHFQNYTYNR